VLARVLKARKQSAAEFVKHFSSTIQDYDIQVGSLVLVTTLTLRKDLTTRQALLHWPHSCCSSDKGGAYILAKLNGAISRLKYASFQVIPYLVRFPDCLPATSLMDDIKLEDVQFCLEDFPPAHDLSDDVVFNE